MEKRQSRPLETKDLDCDLGPEGPERTRDGPIMPLDPRFGKLQGIWVRSGQKDSLQPQCPAALLIPRFGHRGSIEPGQVFQRLRPRNRRRSPANSIDRPAGKRLLFVGGNKDQEWRGDSSLPHVLIKLLRIRAAREDMTALQHDPLAEKLRIGVGGSRHLSGAITGRRRRNRPCRRLARECVDRRGDQRIYTHSTSGGRRASPGFEIGSQLDTHNEPK